MNPSTIPPVETPVLKHLYLDGINTPVYTIDSYIPILHQIISRRDSLDFQRFVEFQTFAWVSKMASSTVFLVAILVLISIVAVHGDPAPSSPECGVPGRCFFLIQHLVWLQLRVGTMSSLPQSWFGEKSLFKGQHLWPSWREPSVLFNFKRYSMASSSQRWRCYTPRKRKSFSFSRTMPPVTPRRGPEELRSWNGPATVQTLIPLRISGGPQGKNGFLPQHDSQGMEGETPQEMGVPWSSTPLESGQFDGRPDSVLHRS